MARPLTASLSEARRRLRREEGFTLVELVVALGVILTALLAMAYLATSGFSQIGYSRQRQTANNLANQTMEQLRALPFQYIANGLATGDLSPVPGLVSQGGCPDAGTWCLTMSGVTEQIPNGTFSYSSVPPLVPHVTTQRVGTAATYTISTYITNYCPNGPNDGKFCQNYVTQIGAYRATVIVTWVTSDIQGVSNRVVSQSVFYNPAGCVSQATHPFQSPCQPFFYGNAGVGQGTVTLTGTVQGTTFQSGSLWLPWYDANLQREQLDQVTGHFQGGGATLTDANGSQNVGQVLCQTQAGNDPATSNPDWQQAPTASTPCSAGLPQTGGNLSTGGGVSLTLSGGGGGNGQTVSTVSASVSPAQPCVNYNYNGISQNDQLPCGSGEGLQGSTLLATLDLTGLPKNLGSATLASVAPPSCTSPTQSPNNCGYAFSNFDAKPDQVNPAWCPTTTVNNGGVGCLHTEAGRSLGTATFGGLPWSGLSSQEQTQVPGWDPTRNLLTVTGFRDRVSAEIGNGTASPPATASVSGSLAFYRGTAGCPAGYSASGNYCTGNITGTPATITVPGVCLYDGSFSGGPLLIAIGSGPVDPASTGCPSPVSQQMTFKVGGASTNAAGSSCSPDPKSCLATSNGPLSGQFYYTVIQNFQVVAQLQVTVNFGQLAAKATYSTG